jgi:hypothetical protein
MASLSVLDNPDHGPNGRFDGGSLFAGARVAEFPAVVTVTVAVAADAPLSATELGETEHVEPAGAPLQLIVTVCSKPPPGVTETI